MMLIIYYSGIDVRVDAMYWLVKSWIGFSSRGLLNQRAHSLICPADHLIVEVLKYIISSLETYTKE